jgi:hypothetical protein
VRFFFAASSIVFFAASLSSVKAHAYCRTTSIPASPSFQPTGDNCWTKGVPVWWKDACLSYEIESTGGKNLPLDAVSQVAKESFATWTSAQCSSGGTITMTVSEGKTVPVACTAVGYVKGAKNNVNEIIFHDDGWPYNDGFNTIALTTLTFNSDTGQILDADIELNTTSGMITTGTPTATTFDLQSVLTHESGHFFGLAHSGHAEATMYSMYKPASVSMRVLAADDIAGICSVYETTSRPTATGPVPSECLSPARGAYDGKCPAPSSNGCNVPGSSGGETSALAALVTALLLSANKIRSTFLGRRRATPRS